MPATLKRFRSWAPQHRRTRAAHAVGRRGGARRVVPAPRRGRGPRRDARPGRGAGRWLRRRPPPTRPTWLPWPTWPVRRAGPHLVGAAAAAAERAGAEAGTARAAEEVAAARGRSWRPSAPGTATSWPRRAAEVAAAAAEVAALTQGAAGGEGGPASGRAGRRPSRPTAAAGRGRPAAVERGRADEVARGRGCGWRRPSRRCWPPAGRCARAAASRTPGPGCCWTPWSRPRAALRRELALPPVERPAGGPRSTPQLPGDAVDRRRAGPALRRPGPARPAARRCRRCT